MKPQTPQELDRQARAICARELSKPNTNAAAALRALTPDEIWTLIAFDTYTYGRPFKAAVRNADTHMAVDGGAMWIKTSSRTDPEGSLA